VRKLAERSQVAAQEIGNLAGTSVQLAEKAGGLLNQMVPSIQKTGELVQEIAAASGEQSEGVGQITGAMNHLSSATQQTASASEELSATAEELSAQAAQLQDLMAFFKLADDGSSSSSSTGAARNARPVMTDDVVFLQRQHAGQRGPKADRIAATSMQPKWIESDQEIFRRLRHEWPLELFVVSRSIRTAEERRSALIQRGVVMARKKLWSEALEDWKSSATLTNGAISPDDAKTLRRAFHGKYGCDEVYRDDTLLISLQEFAKDKAHLNIARCLASGLLRQIKSEFEKGHVVTGLQAAQLMGKLAFQVRLPFAGAGVGSQSPV
jgi:hypothetical protein